MASGLTLDPSFLMPVGGWQPPFNRTTSEQDSWSLFFAKTVVLPHPLHLTTGTAVWTDAREWGAESSRRFPAMLKREFSEPIQGLWMFREYSGTQTKYSRLINQGTNFAPRTTSVLLFISARLVVFSKSQVSYWRNVEYSSFHWTWMEWFWCILLLESLCL